MMEIARIISTPPKRIYRRLPASSSALSAPARSSLGGMTGSSVPNRRTPRDSASDMSSSSCPLTPRARAEQALRQHRGDNDRSDRRALPKRRDAEQIEPVADHHHDEDAD